LDRIVLGIYDGPSGGAALLHGGRLVGAAEEDRLVRSDRRSGLPRAAVQTVLRDAGLRGDRLAAVLVATRSSTYAEGVGESVQLPWLWKISQAIPSPPPLGRRLRASFASARRRRIDEALRSEFGASCPIVFVDHHLAHAAGAALTLGIRDCVAVTMDAGADGAWAVATAFENGAPRRIAAETAGPSLFAVLGAVCDHLGIPEGIDRARRLEELAARGASLHYEALDRSIRSDDGRLLVDDAILKTGGLSSRLKRDARREDIAASALGVAAHHVRRWVTHWYVRTEPAALVLGGDLFEMPSLVRAVLDAPEIPSARVACAPGDSGLPLGAALAGCLRGTIPEPLPPPGRMPSPYLGTSFDEHEIAEVLAREGAAFRHHPHVEEDLARVLAEGRTAARFDGPAEIGRRSLGNRVLLRSPEGSLRRGRLGFVHGAGAYDALVREEDFASAFQEDGVHKDDLRHLPLLVLPREELAARCPDLLGWGRRFRVQAVSAAINPGLHSILTEFRSWTGLPLLAAAPFRLPNEPLVCTPLDALRAFRVLGVDHVAIGRYLVSAHHSPTPGPAIDAGNPVGGGHAPW
jgi:carbamoyltransferase